MHAMYAEPFRHVECGTWTKRLASFVDNLDENETPALGTKKDLSVRGLCDLNEVSRKEASSFEVLDDAETRKL